MKITAAIIVAALVATPTVSSVAESVDVSKELDVISEGCAMHVYSLAGCTLRCLDADSRVTTDIKKIKEGIKAFDDCRVTCDKEAVKEGGETQDKSEGCVGELVFIGIGKLVDLVAWISRKTAYLATGAAKTAFPELAPVWINIAAVGKGIETAASVVS